MVRNARQVLERGQQTDPRIIAIHAFNPSGINVHTTDPANPNKVPVEVILAQSLAESNEWSVESETGLFSGISINNSAGTRVGETPLVIDIEGIAENGNIVFTNEQLSLIRKLSDNPRNQLLGGVITNSD